MLMYTPTRDHHVELFSMSKQTKTFRNHVKHDCPKGVLSMSRRSVELQYQIIHVYLCLIDIF